MELFGKFISWVMVMIITAVLDGLALSILWGWFIVPVFELPRLTIVTAIGISVMISCLTHQCIGNKDDENMVDLVVESIIYPLSSLLIGWILHFFM